LLGVVVGSGLISSLDASLNPEAVNRSKGIGHSPYGREVKNNIKLWQDYRYRAAMTARGGVSSTSSWKSSIMPTARRRRSASISAEPVLLMPAPPVPILAWATQRPVTSAPLTVRWRQAMTAV